MSEIIVNNIKQYSLVDIANHMVGEYTIKLIDPLPNNIDESTHIFRITPRANNRFKCSNILAYNQIIQIDGLTDTENTQIKDLYDSVKTTQDIVHTADTPADTPTDTTDTTDTTYTPTDGGKRKNKTKQNKTKQNKTKQNKTSANPAVGYKPDDTRNAFEYVRSQKCIFVKYIFITTLVFSYAPLHKTQYIPPYPPHLEILQMTNRLFARDLLRLFLDFVFPLPQKQENPSVHRHIFVDLGKPSEL